MIWSVWIIVRQQGWDIFVCETDSFSWWAWNIFFRGGDFSHLPWQVFFSFSLPLKPLDWSWMAITPFGEAGIPRLVKSWNTGEAKISCVVSMVIDQICTFPNLERWYVNFLWLVFYSGRQNFTSYKTPFTVFERHGICCLSEHFAHIFWLLWDFD